MCHVFLPFGDYLIGVVEISERLCHYPHTFVATEIRQSVVALANLVIADVIVTLMKKRNGRRPSARPDTE